ncbi:MULTISPECIES: flagellar biosynthesis anti-sigma factor FlgM [Campylobacter]|uniref:flagellar biosynthesis anti-sigma factor FlgM n=1 Tax=Campylobacter TaxID=194 RepID=UPI000A34D2A9|nr:flagellar biosynthesis anti-sigma factor FlgM [Campylobacter sp. P0024]MCR8679790.1 flagellar biosynthesis anti-sigma factor FlgM [Campylobacter sp. RM19072]
MIGSIKASGIYSSIATPKNENKKNEDITQTQSSTNNKIKELSAMIQNGEYKVDIDALSKKIADSLM